MKTLVKIALAIVLGTAVVDLFFGVNLTLLVGATFAPLVLVVYILTGVFAPIYLASK